MSEVSGKRRASGAAPRRRECGVAPAWAARRPARTRTLHCAARARHARRARGCRHRLKLKNDEIVFGSGNYILSSEPSPRSTRSRSARDRSRRHARTVCFLHLQQTSLPSAQPSTAKRAEKSARRQRARQCLHDVWTSRLQVGPRALFSFRFRCVRATDAQPGSGGHTQVIHIHPRLGRSALRPVCRLNLFDADARDRSVCSIQVTALRPVLCEITRGSDGSTFLSSPTAARYPPVHDVLRLW